MFPYIFILLLFLVGFTAKKKKPFFYICAVCMFLVVALRAWVVGVDTETNIYVFQNSIGDYHPTEPLWDAYVVFMRSITDNPQIFLATTALLTLLPLYILIYKKSEFILLALFVYFILPNDQGYIFIMSGIRQAIAITLVLWMYHCFENRKWVWVAILVTAAFLIHNSSVIAFAGLLLAALVKPNQVTAAIIMVAALVFMGLSFSMKDVFSIIENTSLMQIAFIEDYSSYANYLENEYSLTFFGTLNLILPLMMMSALILLNPKVLDTLYARLYLLGAILITMFSGVPMISRYFMYFIIPEVYVLPQIYLSKEKKFNKTLCKILLFYQAVILFLYLYFNYVHGLDYNVRRVTPYFFFFEKGFNAF